MGIQKGEYISDWEGRNLERLDREKILIRTWVVEMLYGHTD